MTNESIACKGSCAYIFLFYSYFYRILFRGLNLEASNQIPQTRGFKLEAVDNGADVTEDAVELTKTVDVVVDTFLAVPLDEGSSLVVVNVKTLLDGLSVVVRAAALLSTLDETLHQLLLGNVELNHGCYLVSALSEHGLESLCLRDGAGETPIHTVSALPPQVWSGARMTITP